MDTKSLLLLLFATMLLARSGASNQMRELSGDQRIEGIEPARYVNISGHFYYLSPPNTFGNTAFEAQEFCTSVNQMTFLSLESEDKNQLIREYLVANGYLSKFWTSGQLTGGAWQWGSLQQPFTFTDWHAANQEPNYNGTEDACLLFDGLNGWADAACTELQRFMCE